MKRCAFATPETGFMSGHHSLRSPPKRVPSSSALLRYLATGHNERSDPHCSSAPRVPLSGHEAHVAKPVEPERLVTATARVLSDCREAEGLEQPDCMIFDFSQRMPL